jgi:hypothetical protein
MNERRQKLVRFLLEFVPGLATFAFFSMKFMKFGGEVVGAILLIVVIMVFYGNIVHLWQKNDELLFQMDELRKNIEKAVNHQAGVQEG